MGIKNLALRSLGRNYYVKIQDVEDDSSAKHTTLTEKPTIATSEGQSSAGTVTRPSLAGLPPSVQRQIVECLDPFSKICLQRATSHFFRTMDFNLVEFLSNETVTRPDCAQFALLAVLEQDGRTRRISCGFGWLRIKGARLYACAEHREFHPAAYFGSWPDRLDRKSRERRCYSPRPRLETGTQNQWMVEPRHICMHCGAWKLEWSGSCFCRRECPYCLWAMHNYLTRTHTPDGRKTLYYWFDRGRSKIQLVVRGVRGSSRLLTKREMVLRGLEP